VARYDLICPTALRGLAKTMAEGLNKYGLDNWSKGMDILETANHAITHIYQWLGGDRSEPHLDHAMANLAFLTHFYCACDCHEQRQVFTAQTENYTRRFGVKENSEPR